MLKRDSIPTASYQQAGSVILSISGGLSKMGSNGKKRSLIWVIIGNLHKENVFFICFQKLHIKGNYLNIGNAGSQSVRNGE